MPQRPPRSGLVQTGQRPAIHLDGKSPTRPCGEAACRPGINRARHPFYRNLPGRWPIFGVIPVGERLGDEALSTLYSPPSALMEQAPVSRFESQI